MKVTPTYWREEDDVQNLGDYLTRYMMEEVFFHDGLPSSGIHIVGSVMDDMFLGREVPENRPIIFWGCGMRSEDGISPSNRHKMRVTAIRGMRSAERLGLKGIPLGDIAFLLPALHPAPAPSDRSICIPHFHDDRSDSTLLGLSGADQVLRTRIANGIPGLVNAVDAIAGASFVLSASLHGALLAAAYQRPFCFWDNGHLDLPFKWQDTASMLGIPVLFAGDVTRAKVLYASEIGPALSLPDIWEFLNTAPLKIRPQAHRRLIRHLFSGDSPDDGAGRLPRWLNIAERRSMLVQAMDSDGVAGDDELSAHQVRELILRGHLERVTKSKRKAETTVSQLTQRLAAGPPATPALHPALHGRVDQLAARVTILERSTSWRATAPLRRMGDRIPWMRPLLRKSAKGLGLLRDDGSKPPPGMDRDVVDSASMAEVSAPSTASDARSAASRLRHTITEKIAKSKRPVALYVDSRYPMPDRDAGSIDALNYIEGLIEKGFTVIFMADSELEMPPAYPYRKALTDRGVVTVGHDEEVGSVGEILEACGDLVDVCFLARVWSGGRWIEWAKRLAPQAPVIFITVDLHHVREAREASLLGDAAAMYRAMSTREREIAVARLASVTVVVSTSEVEILHARAPGSRVLMIAPWRRFQRTESAFEDRSGIGFIGGFAHTPNLDAVVYFLDRIYPEVRAALGDVPFIVVGRGLPEEVASRRDPGFRYLGPVDDLAPVFSTLRLTVAPLRAGAGSKGKILTSLGMGVPCVATPIATEGMGFAPGEEIIEVDLAGFGGAIRDVYSDPQRWERLANAGYEALRRSYSIERRMTDLDKILATARGS